MTASVDGPYCAIRDAAHRPCDPADPERRPCAGWVASPGGWLLLRITDGLWAEVPASKDTDADAFAWQVLAEDADGSVILRSGAGVGEAAQLAAEDALRAVAAEIVRAVGR